MATDGDAATMGTSSPVITPDPAKRKKGKRIIIPKWGVQKVMEDSLRQAIYEGNFTKLKICIRTGMDLNSVDETGANSFILAVKQSKYYELQNASFPKHDLLKILSLLRKQKVNLKATDYKGNNALHYAVGKAMIITLLRYQVDPYHLNKYGQPPIAYILYTNLDISLAAIMAYQREGGNIATPDLMGKTQMHKITERGHNVLLTKLVQTWVPVSIPDNEGS